jgi:hypothetical protein
MWEDMLVYFNQELKDRRADVEGLARVLSFGPNTVTVDNASRLSPQVRIDIVSADRAERELATGRTVTSVRGRVIGYNGPSVSAGTPHRLRLARTQKFDKKYAAVDNDIFLLLRRAAPQDSDYAPDSQKADWFLAWVVGEREEEAIARDPARAAFVKEHQLIEYTRERDGAKTITVGWFPLWRPSLAKGVPHRRNGKIARVEEVVVNPRQVAGWTYFFDPDPARRDLVPVVRPREL